MLFRSQNRDVSHQGRRMLLKIGAIVTAFAAGIYGFAKFLRESSGTFGLLPQPVYSRGDRGMWCSGKRSEA